MHLSPSPSLSNHRLARLMSWARVWFAALARVLTAAFGARALDDAARLLGDLIFLHAAARVGPPESWRHARNKHAGWKPAVRAGGTRAVIGVELRRALRGREAQSRLAALLAIVRDPEFHIAKLARRLARGLSRRRVVLPTPARGAVAPAADAPNPRCACADTS